MTDDATDSADSEPIVLLAAKGCTVTLEHRESSVSVALKGDVDLENADDILAALRPLIEQVPARVDLDLAELDFIDSFGISRLILAQQSAIDFGVALSLRHPRPSTRRVFVVAGLTDYLRVD